MGSVEKEKPIIDTIYALTEYPIINKTAFASLVFPNVLPDTARTKLNQRKSFSEEEIARLQTVLAPMKAMIDRIIEYEKSDS